MIGLFTDAGARLPVTYNGLTLNNPSDPKDDRYELNIVVPTTAINVTVEPHPSSDGSEAYTPYRASRNIRLLGVIRAPSVAKLYDKMKSLAAAFDPAVVAYNNPTDSFLALDFSTPTTDTTNFPSGLAACRYYARARTVPEPMVSVFGGWSAFFSIDLFVRDPRRYVQTASTVTGTGTAANTVADTVSWPTVTITATGAGSATYSVANTTLGKTLTLNLSGLVNGNTVTVDMARAKVSKNGVETPSLFVSGNYWPIQPGNNTITVTNGTNVTTVTSWRPAFSL